MSQEEIIPSAPPPSYEDVIAAGSSIVVSPSPQPPPVTPSAPPPPSSQNRRTNAPRNVSQEGRNSRDAGRTRQHSTTPLRESSTPGRQYNRAGSLHQMSPSSQPPSGQNDNFIEKLARFNMPGIMLAGLMIPTIDVELDSEAHLPNRGTTRKLAKRRKRLKTICASLWCFAFVLLFFLVAVPVAMLLTGVFGYDSCPYRQRIILACLLAIGSLLILTIALRLSLSCVTCCKLTNMCNTENSMSCSVCIGISEAIFVLLLVVTAVIILLGTWFMFETTPQFEPISNSDTEYCNRGVYFAGVIMMVFTYLLGFCVVVYLGVAALTYCTFREELGMKSHKRRQRQRAPRTSSF